MSRLVVILGPTGVGKSRSITEFKKDEAQVISCSGKELPRKTDLSVFIPKNYSQLYAAIDKASAPAVVIDDLNFMMVEDEFSRAKEVGYGKFTDVAVNMNTVFQKIRSKESDQTFYVLAHPEDRDDIHPNLEFRISAGKMSKKFPIGAMTNIVLEALMTEDGEFVFSTKTNGLGVKSPEDMFPTPDVPNNLREVDKIIREYYS